MSLLGSISTVIGGGIAGGVLTYGLTWLRERRRLIDAYRAPHREAISVIIVATHELLAREADFRHAMNDLANESEGKPGTDQARNHLDRALLGLERAFNVGRITIVDSECFEAMGTAYNEFTKINTCFAEFEHMEQTPSNIGRVTGELAAHTSQLHKAVADLVVAGQRRVSPVQSWLNKRRRENVRKRLDAEYFKPPQHDAPGAAGTEHKT
jgi:hypothetical protein